MPELTQDLIALQEGLFVDTSSTESTFEESLDIYSQFAHADGGLLSHPLESFGFNLQAPFTSETPIVTGDWLAQSWMHACASVTLGL